MLSFMKEEDNQGNVSQDDSSSGNSSSGDLSGGSSQGTSLNEALKAGGGGSDASDQDFLVPSSSGKKVKYSTVILGVVFLVGAALLFFMITKFGPGEAKAGLSEDELKIESAIAKLSGSKVAINDRMNNIVDRISSLSEVEQVSVDELKRNPFKQDSDGVDVGSFSESDISASGLRLWSVMESSGEKSCMINERLYQVGDRVGNYTVKRIGEGFVELTAGQMVLVLRMSK